MTLVLSRRRDQSIIVGDNIVVTVVGIRNDKVRLGFDAPREIGIFRKKIYLEKQKEAAAATGARPPSPLDACKLVSVLVSRPAETIDLCKIGMAVNAAILHVDPKWDGMVPSPPVAPVVVPIERIAGRRDHPPEQITAAPGNAGAMMTIAQAKRKAREARKVRRVHIEWNETGG